jgi:transcription initiation factor IIE alpha subunit
MDDEKYTRNVSLLCPTCGCTQFKYEKGVDETIEIAQCASCGREITKDELIKENMENLLEHTKEIGKQAVKPRWPEGTWPGWG